MSAKCNTCMNVKLPVQTCWSIRDSRGGGSSLWCTGGAIVTLGCPAGKKPCQIFQTNTVSLTLCIYSWSRGILPVCLRGVSPNKSLTTARALSERARTSFNNSWSENTYRSKHTSSSLPISDNSENAAKDVPKNHSKPTNLSDDAEAGLV